MCNYMDRFQLPLICKNFKYSILVMLLPFCRHREAKLKIFHSLTSHDSDAFRLHVVEFGDSVCEKTLETIEFFEHELSPLLTHFEMWITVPLILLFPSVWFFKGCRFLRLLIPKLKGYDMLFKLLKELGVGAGSYNEPACALGQSFLQHRNYVPL